MPEIGSIPEGARRRALEAPPAERPYREEGLVLLDRRADKIGLMEEGTRIRERASERDLIVCRQPARRPNVRYRRRHRQVDRRRRQPLRDSISAVPGARRLRLGRRVGCLRHLLRDGRIRDRRRRRHRIRDMGMSLLSGAVVVRPSI